MAVRPAPLIRFQPGDLKALAILFLAAGLLLGLGLLQLIGALIMRRISIVAALAVAAVVLSGCGTLGGISGSDSRFGEKLLDNIEHCDREYIGNAGLGANLQVRIKCPAKPYDAAPAPVAP